MKTPEIEPAPKRGQYDRALSRRDRQAAQRERVIISLAALSDAGRELSITNVVELAGIGRNTFYEYFDDVEHALTVIRARALSELISRVEASLQVARTPVERVRALARAWAENLLNEPALAKLALRAQPDTVSALQLSVLAQHVARVLSAQLESRATLPGLADATKTNAVAAVFDAVSRSHFSSRQVSSEELSGTLVDLCLRLLR